MAYTEVKNDDRRTIATIRTHGRTGFIELQQRRRWTAEDAAQVAYALLDVVEDAPRPPDPMTLPPSESFEITDMGEPVNEDIDCPNCGPDEGCERCDARTLVPERPPAQGRGSSRKAWTEYAKAHNVPVTSDMSRDDIVAACEAALPTV